MTILQSYKDLKIIAEGGQTEIFSAVTSEPLKRRVAIKKLTENFSNHSESRQALKSEIQLLLEMNHPNFLHALDFHEDSKECFSVLEFIDGWNLRTILNHWENISQKPKEWFCLWLIRELAFALIYLHSAKDSLGKSLEIVHGDINPKNILISKSGHLKLIDFTISQSLLSPWEKQDRVGRGSVSYMAPEQATRQEMSPCSDFFSLGVVFYEMFMGQKPFSGKNKFEVQKNIQNLEIFDSDFPDSIHPKIKGSILTLLAKSPTNRFQEAKEISKIISPILHIKYPGLTPQVIGQYLTRLLENP